MSDTVEYPCDTCHKNCDGDNNSACDTCDKWFHQKCEGLSNKDLNYLQKCPLSYVCTKCCKTAGGDFDFDESLERLGIATRSGDVEKALKLEAIFMRFLPKRMKTGKPFQFVSTMKRDKVATKVLGKSDLIPTKVSGNGNCLFNSLSMAIQGNESLASEIRVRTCIEMQDNKDFYQNIYEIDRLSLVSPPFDEALMECCLNYYFSSGWTMHAASSVISQAIKSVYPAVNGYLDPSVEILNCLFEPRKLKTKHTVHILWSSMTFRKGYWETNHFVHLLKPVQDILLIDISDETEFSPLSPITSPRRQSIESTPAPPLSLIQFSTVDHCYAQNIEYCSTYDSLISLNNTESPRQSATDKTCPSMKTTLCQVSTTLSPHKKVQHK